MLAVLLAIVLIAVTLLALSVAGVVAAIVAGVAWLNVSVIVLGLRSRPARSESPVARGRWRPSSFPPPSEPPDEAEEASPPLTVHRH